MNDLRNALDTLTTVMLERGMPHLDWLRPDLPSEDARATLTQAGYPVTDEILAWFSWHNGAIRDNDLDGVNGEIAFTGNHLLPLDAALIEADANWGVFQEGIDEDEWIAREYADNPWRSRWIPILDRGGDSLAADLASDSDASPLIAVGWETMPSQWPRFPSITALVSMYIDVIRNHAIWSPNNRGWEIELTELTPIQRSFC